MQEVPAMRSGDSWDKYTLKSFSDELEDQFSVFFNWHSVINMCSKCRIAMKAKVPDDESKTKQKTPVW